MINPVFFEQMCSDFRRLGIEEGDALLVHSSLRSLGLLPDKAEMVVEALLKVLGPEGTLLFPALSYRDVTVESPYFDVLKTPCCVGSLPEYFRTRPGTVRSVHPTHSMSGVGKHVSFLFKDHQLDTTSCGPNSPFRKLRELKSKILFLGCSIASNTSMHAVEELVPPPYLHREAVSYRVVLADGSETTMNVRRHNFKGWCQAYARLAGILSPEELRHGAVFSASCALMDIPAMWEKAYAELQKNPLAFAWKYDI